MTSIPPTPPAPAKSIFRSTKFWLLLALAGVLCSCLVCGGILALLMMQSAVSPVVLPQITSNSPPKPASAPPDDFIYHAPNGADFIPALTVIARGKEVSLAGTWREDHQGFLLALNADASYLCQDSGSSGRTAATTVETGQWSLVAGKLHLVPSSVKLHTVSGTRQMSQDIAAGPPRDMTVEGLVLQYTPYDQPNAPPRTIDGLAVEGDVPTWAYSMTGKWKWTLRRAP